MGFDKIEAGVGIVDMEECAELVKAPVLKTGG